MRKISFSKQVNVLFKKHFIGLSTQKAAKSGCISTKSLYRIEKTNTEVVKLLEDAKKQMAQELINAALKSDIKQNFIKAIELSAKTMADPKKHRSSSIVQESLMLKNLFECFDTKEEKIEQITDGEKQACKKFDKVLQKKLVECDGN